MDVVETGIGLSWLLTVGHISDGTVVVKVYVQSVRVVVHRLHSIRPQHTVGFGKILLRK
jgi:hypothetical protein